MDNNLFLSDEKTILYAKITAIASFFIGSSILLFYYLSHSNTIIYFALFFMVLAFSINGYLFIVLIVHLVKKSALKNKILLTLLLMLINLPIGYFYLEIGLHIYSYSITN